MWSWYPCMQNFRPFLMCSQNAWKVKLHKVVLASGGTKLGQHWPKSIISGSFQDTSACHISGHSFHAFSLECSETPISLSFLGHQRAILAKLNKFWRWSGYISMPHFKTFLPCILLRISLCFLAIRRLKLGQCQPESNNFWWWSGYISRLHFGAFLLCILLRMLGNLPVTGQTDGRWPTLCPHLTLSPGTMMI